MSSIELPDDLCSLIGETRYYEIPDGFFRGNPDIEGIGVNIALPLL